MKKALLPFVFCISALVCFNEVFGGKIPLGICELGEGAKGRKEWWTHLGSGYSVSKQCAASNKCQALSRVENVEAGKIGEERWNRPEYGVSKQRAASNKCTWELGWGAIGQALQWGASNKCESCSRRKGKYSPSGLALFIYEELEGGKSVKADKLCRQCAESFLNPGEALVDGVDCQVDEKQLHHVFLSCIQLDNVREKTISWRPGFKEVDLSGLDLVRIAPLGFHCLGELRVIKFPATLEEVGYSAFFGCASVKVIDLTGTKVRRIGFWSLSGCRNLEYLGLPKTLVEVGELAISECYKLRELNLSKTQISELGQSFNKCSGLEIVQLPITLAAVRDGAFASCDSLRALDFSGMTGVKQIMLAAMPPEAVMMCDVDSSMLPAWGALRFKGWELFGARFDYSLEIRMKNASNRALLEVRGVGSKSEFQELWLLANVLFNPELHFGLRFASARPANTEVERRQRWRECVEGDVSKVLGRVGMVRSGAGWLGEKTRGLPPPGW